MMYVKLLSYKEMQRQWATEYNGNDPTNMMSYTEQYTEVEEPQPDTLQI